MSLTDRQLHDIEQDAKRTTTDPEGSGLLAFFLARHIQYLLDEVAQLKAELVKAGVRGVPLAPTAPSYPGAYPLKRLNPNPGTYITASYGCPMPSPGWPPPDLGARAQMQGDAHA